MKISAFICNSLVSILVILSLFHADLSGQTSIKQTWDSVYGTDANIINGSVYRYPYYHVKGHPFLDGDEFFIEWIQINRQQYTGQAIRLDIVDNKVILQHTNELGNLSHILLVDSLINAFTCAGRYFKKYQVPGKGVKFVQILNKGDVVCFYYWYKEMKVSNSAGASGYRFTNQKKVAFLSIGGKSYRYKSKGSFVKLFQEESRSLIQNYIRSRQLKWSKISDKEMEELMGYCNSLL